MGAGYISDLYPIEERGSAFGKYMFGVISGPLLGPVIDGVFNNVRTFRDNEKFDGLFPMSRNKTMEYFNIIQEIRRNEVNSVISESVNTEQQSARKRAVKRDKEWCFVRFGLAFRGERRLEVGVDTNRLSKALDY
ncbi:hypothetical protein BDF21DRAFT_463948 [Thamnidium elegans]|nr:hypothetical protein BDF21DRAFT_463948 [Thamnidium elegans]